MSPSPEKVSILVVDDIPDTLEVIERHLKSEGYRVFTAPGVAEAIKILDREPIEIVVTDLKMPGASGIDLVRHVRENCKDTQVMVITGYGTIESAVEAVKTGAEDYLRKPFTDEELSAAIRRVLEKLHARRSARFGPEPPAQAAYGLLGQSEKMRDVARAVAKAVCTSATVLISGESGSGKEVVARAIHYNSPRASAPFVPVNCGGIPEGLLESELFGHVKGAFTGALESRAGFFQTADGGTIFLDEVGDTSPSMQAKLLRVLEDKMICMVGSKRPRKVDVRILAATNKDLSALIEKGLFREDLFYRLNVISINIPPLRERDNDVLLLACHFAARFAEELGKQTPRFSDQALQALKNYRWPGNVRELQNVIHGLIVMNEGDYVDIPDLPSLMRFSASSEGGLNRTLAQAEADYIRNVLASVNGNKTRAAQILGIDRKTLRKKLSDH